MSPGPPKSFDPEVALERAVEVFWKRGFDGAGLSELEQAMGLNRKSLYDTFGNKRELYCKALQRYSDTVLARIASGLEDPRNGPLENLERVLRKMQQHHATPHSQGCLLGVAMAQIATEDEELAAVLRGYLKDLEDAFVGVFQRAQKAREVRPSLKPRDMARAMVALTQGMALVGRVTDTTAVPRSMVRAALQSFVA